MRRDGVLKDMEHAPPAVNPRNTVSVGTAPAASRPRESKAASLAPPRSRRSGADYVLMLLVAIATILCGALAAGWVLARKPVSVLPAPVSRETAPERGLSSTAKALVLETVPGTRGDVSTRMIRIVDPVYPAPAGSLAIEGAIWSSAMVRSDGTISAVRGISGNPQLLKAASEAVAQWRYQPAPEQHSDREQRIQVVFLLAP